jgi:hypothetical protein
MSSPSEEKQASLEEDYYELVERYFVGLRGSPLFVTPKDWQLIHSWRTMEIPIKVVKEGLEQAFEKRKSARPVRGLSYCRQTVESAFRRYCEALAGSHHKTEEREEVVTIQRYLKGLTAQLEKASQTHKTSRQELSEVASQSARKLASLVAESMEQDSYQDIEALLKQVDEELLGAASRSMSDKERRRCQLEAQKALESYRSRMPEDVYSSALESAFRKRVRAHLGLPALSLFYM